MNTFRRIQTMTSSAVLTLPRNVLRGALASVVTILALVVGVAPAQAAPYAAGGAWGPYVATSPIDCRHKVFGASSLLHMYAPAPVVYAKNSRSGGGNDAAWVRFRTFLVNHKTGQTVSSNGWSAWVYAYDNRAARWTGEQFFSADARNGNMYRVDYRIEYWNQTQMIGWVADRSTSYYYYDNGNVGPIGLSACWRYR